MIWVRGSFRDEGRGRECSRGTSCRFHRSWLSSIKRINNHDDVKNLK